MVVHGADGMIMICRQRLEPGGSTADVPDAEMRQANRDPYRGLREHIWSIQDDPKQRYWPRHCSLGPNGAYHFVNERNPEVPGSKPTEAYHYPEDFPAENDDVLKRVWWGKDGSYVVDREGGSRTWRLLDHYPGLDMFLRDGIGGCKSIKVSRLPT